MLRLLTLLTSILYATAAPVYQPDTHSKRGESSKYIVVLKDSLPTDGLSYEESILSTMSARGHAPLRTISLGAFKSYAVTLDPEELEILSQLEAVDSIHADLPIHTLEIASRQQTDNSTILSQENATWGLSRISNTSPNATSYNYNPNPGQGIHVYVIDSGIDITHPDFEGRAVFGTNTHDITNTSASSGHGTHVAGTVGSKTYGVAKAANLISVRVFDNDNGGVHSDFMAGLEWAVQHARNNSYIGKAVINMSLGGPRNYPLDQMVYNAALEGLHIITAAGNGGRNSWLFPGNSPGGAGGSCNVGATERNDTMLSFSNFGQTVDLLAPGGDILSLELNHTYGASKSGTSMASPHVAGLAAVLLAQEGSRSPDELCARLVELARPDVIQGGDREGTPNLLAYNGVGL